MKLKTTKLLWQCSFEPGWPTRPCRNLWVCSIQLGERPGRVDIKDTGYKKSAQSMLHLVADIFPCFSPVAGELVWRSLFEFCPLDVLKFPWLSVVCFGSDLVTISPHKKKENHNSNQNNPGKFAKQQPCTYVEISLQKTPLYKYEVNYSMVQVYMTLVNLLFNNWRVASYHLEVSATF